MLELENRSSSLHAIADKDRELSQLIERHSRCVGQFHGTQNEAHRALVLVPMHQLGGGIVQRRCVPRLQLGEGLVCRDGPGIVGTYEALAELQPRNATARASYVA